MESQIGRQHNRRTATLRESYPIQRLDSETPPDRKHPFGRVSTNEEGEGPTSRIIHHWGTLFIAYNSRKYIFLHQKKKKKFRNGQATTTPHRHLQGIGTLPPNP